MPLERRVRLARLARLEQLERRARRVRLEARDPLERMEQLERLEPLGRLARLGPRDPLESLTTARLLGDCVLATGGVSKMKASLLCSATTKALGTIGMQCSLRATRTSRY